MVNDIKTTAVSDICAVNVLKVSIFAGRQKFITQFAESFF